MTKGVSRGGGVCRKLLLWVALLPVWLVSTPATASADVVLDWNAIAARTFTAGQSPFHQARLMAITQLAVFEAVNAVTGEYEPYLAPPVPRSPDASPEAAAIAAAYTVLKDTYPLNTAIDTDRANALAAIPDGFAKTSGIALGEAVAVAVMDLRETDGFSPPASFVPSSTLAGDWQMLSSSHASRKTDAFAAQFDVPVPASGQAVLRYRVRVRY